MTQISIATRLRLIAVSRETIKQDMPPSDVFMNQRIIAHHERELEKLVKAAPMTTKEIELIREESKTILTASEQMEYYKLRQQEGSV